MAAGQAVLDLGCAPGSWLLFASERVGPRGRVVGVDLEPPRVSAPNVTLKVADVFTVDPATLGGPFDVVLSDMAPSTTGARFVDQQRSLRLFLRALDVAEATLKLGGSFAGKIFEGEDFPLARERLRRLFDAERILKPKGTRSESYEVYLVGLGRR